MRIKNSISDFRTEPKKFIIRDIQKSDLKLIYQMLQDLVEYDKILEKFKLTEKEMCNYLFSEKFPWSCLVVENLPDNSLKGFLLYTFSYINRAFHLKPQVYIDHLYIKPDYRGFGAGNSLIEELKNRLKKYSVNRIEVWCMKTNKIGNLFYRKIGFKEINANIYQIKLEGS